MSVDKVKRLENGETFVTQESGNSMSPKIKHRQKHVLEPATWEDVEKDDIVYCKVNGNYYTHLVVGKNDKRGVQIANNRGHVNGWTKKVYGKVIDIIKDDGKSGGKDGSH